MTCPAPGPSGAQALAGEGIGEGRWCKPQRRSEANARSVKQGASERLHFGRHPCQEAREVRTPILLGWYVIIDVARPSESVYESRPRRDFRGERTTAEEAEGVRLASEADRHGPTLSGSGLLRSG